MLHSRQRSVQHLIQFVIDHSEVVVNHIYSMLHRMDVSVRHAMPMSTDNSTTVSHSTLHRTFHDASLQDVVVQRCIRPI